MSDMVERVARAMVTRVARDAGLAPVTLKLHEDHYWHEWEDDARAAVEALRDHAPVLRDEAGVIHELRGAPEDIWRLLIDAALADGA